MMITFFVLDRKYPFWAYLVQKIKIVNLSEIWYLQSVTKINDTYYIFIKNFLKNYLACSEISKIPPSPWLNVVPSLKNRCPEVLARNEHANLQPTLSKGTGVASLTDFITDCREI